MSEMKLLPSGLRGLGYEDYNISRFRLAELKAACRRYAERENAKKYGPPAVSLGNGGQGGSFADPTASAAAWNLKLDAENEKIRLAARAAAVFPCNVETGQEYEPGLADLLFRSVTNGTGYDKLFPAPYMTQADFYGRRRLFYAYLNSIW